MKVFISQKMRGWKPEEILKVREEVEALIRRNHGDNVEIIDSYHPEFADMKPAAAIAKSLALLAEADAVYFAGDPYEGGMAIERAVCETYKIPFVIAFRDGPVSCTCSAR
ncbi:MAG: hypothetical protein IKN72_03735 [Clostridia bacterium]|nr:hypothetical protein [Clostridia bacterium]